MNSSRPTFVRARTPQQRDQRRDSILTTARRLLLEQRVTDLSLNEIARQVGLAKSNVLRYFGSREAILLTIVEQEYCNWVTEVSKAVASHEAGTRAENIDFLAQTVATTINNYPLLCELLSCTSSVLEHNVTATEIIKFKLQVYQHIDRLVSIMNNLIGEMDKSTENAVIIAMHGIITEIWSVAHPPPALITAQQEDSRIRTTVDSVTAMRDGLWLLFAGIVARGALTNK